jgi:GABA(A) receptor-associated protein
MVVYYTCNRMSNYIINAVKFGINVFTDNHNVLYTKEEAIRVRNKYPDRIPIIVHRSKVAGSDVPQIDKHKFLVPSDLTMGQFQYVIRKRLTLSPEKALFLFVNNAIVPTSSLVSKVYDDYQDEDNMFLFVTYAMENAFG